MSAGGPCAGDGRAGQDTVPVAGVTWQPEPQQLPCTQRLLCAGNHLLESRNAFGPCSAEDYRNILKKI